ncbi:MAG: DUF559 domain-containing protein [Sphingomonadales bacterium]|jgi:very-short-patch-repair endonuclease|nr:DUF559 domain-containing protein [Sphingomonadales bacterium]
MEIVLKRLALPAGTVARSRRLRREMTRQERSFWRAIREAFPEVHFRKQVPLGSYHADFACHKARLVIELDGGQHARPEAEKHDEIRSRFLESQGYRVIRFWNNDVDNNLEGVLSVVAQELSA